jgi:drug/metabolite transporter (DMT)-like permease
VTGTAAWTAGALVAFAANSLLCRVALGRASIDPAGFTAVRLVSGAVVLSAFGTLRRSATAEPSRAGWTSASMLFLYAAAFSFAYVTLTAGTGALILFGAVQITMIVAGLAAGERFRIAEGVGLAGALAGLGILVAPGIAAPSPWGAALMAVAGISWGVYSLRGRGARDPLRETAVNFRKAVPLAACLVAVALRRAHVTAEGAMWAALSGAVASGLGYVVWYAALRGLSAIRAATVQLAVPVLAAAGGVLFLGEHVSARLVVAAVLVLGGIALAVAGRGAHDPPPVPE